MMLEWSDQALADLDRFVEFLDRKHPSLAPVVAREIVDKAQILSAHPQLGRPLAVVKNIARSCYRSSARLTSFNIVSMAGVL
jgi:plasmid stabilization system protein ParE